MALALSDLLSELTADQVKSSILTIASGLGLQTSTWKVGDPELTIVTAVSQQMSGLWNKWSRRAIEGGFLDHASGPWLTLGASNVFNVSRITADYAVGGWTGTNSTGASIPATPGDLVFTNEDGKTYRNQDAVTFLPGVPLIIQIIADEIGTDSDAAPGTISLLNGVPGLTGTNAASVLGIDEEEDDALRARCRLKLASLSPNGPAAAYEYVCLSPEFHGVTVTRVKVSPYSETGTVDVLIAGPSGEIASGDVDLVEDAVHQNCTPDSVTSTVASATGVTIPVTYTAYAYAKSGLDTAVAEAAIADALADHFRTLPIGGDIIPPSTDGVVFLNAIEAVIRGATTGIVQVVVTAPAADVVLAPTEVGVLGTITGTVTLL